MTQQFRTNRIIPLQYLKQVQASAAVGREAKLLPRPSPWSAGPAFISQSSTALNPAQNWRTGEHWIHTSSGCAGNWALSVCFWPERALTLSSCSRSFLCLKAFCSMSWGLFPARGKSPSSSQRFTRTELLQHLDYDINVENVLLDSWVLHTGKTLQNEGLVTLIKSWLSPATSAAMGKWLSWIRDRKPSYITITCSHRGVGGWVDYVCYNLKLSNW